MTPCPHDPRRSRRPPGQHWLPSVARFLKGASKEMEKSMTKKELEELASTSHKHLPDKKDKS